VVIGVEVAERGGEADNGGVEGFLERLFYRYYGEGERWRVEFLDAHGNVLYEVLVSDPPIDETVQWTVIDQACQVSAALLRGGHDATTYPLEVNSFPVYLMPGDVLKFNVWFRIS